MSRKEWDGPTVCEHIFREVYAWGLCQPCYMDEYQKKHPDTLYQPRVSITQEEYENLLRQQEGKCKICGGGNSRAGRFVVDHDHHTGRIRALLCHQCNTAIGLLQDDPELVWRAVQYLEEFTNYSIAFPAPTPRKD